MTLEEGKGGTESAPRFGQRINGVLFYIPANIEYDVESLFESLKKPIGISESVKCNRFYQVTNSRTWVLEFKEPHQPDHLFGTSFNYKGVEIPLRDPNAPRKESAIIRIHWLPAYINDNTTSNFISSLNKEIKVINCEREMYSKESLKGLENGVRRIKVELPPGGRISLRKFVGRVSINNHTGLFTIAGLTQCFSCSQFGHVKAKCPAPIQTKSSYSRLAGAEKKQELQDLEVASTSDSTTSTSNNSAPVTQTTATPNIATIVIDGIAAQPTSSHEQSGHEAVSSLEIARKPKRTNSQTNSSSSSPSNHFEKRAAKNNEEDIDMERDNESEDDKNDKNAAIPNESNPSSLPPGDVPTLTNLYNSIKQTVK